MLPEEVEAGKAILGSRTRAWTKPPHDAALVVRQSMSIPIGFTSEAFGVVFTAWNRTLLRSLMRFSVLCE